jgi:FixJ family two-component response regulator
MKLPTTIYVVDDDGRVLKALRNLLQASGYVVQDFSSPEAFLERHDPARPGCVLCDIAMPGLDGLALQQALKERGCLRPFIFLTGHGSIPGSVQAIKAGALNYLTKPVDETVLLPALRAAIKRDAAVRAVHERIASLTGRERQVMERIAAGQMNKEMAGECRVAERTIKFHRANLMRKLEVTSTARLVSLVIQAGLLPALTPFATEADLTGELAPIPGARARRV